MRITERQFNALWEERSRFAVSYDDARQLVFALGERKPLMSGRPNQAVWYALVDGRVIEGYESGCHTASLPTVHGRTFDNPADALAALADDPRVVNLRGV